MKIIKNWKKILICSVAIIPTVFGITMSVVSCSKVEHAYAYDWGLDCQKILNDFEEMGNYRVEINGHYESLKNKDIIDYNGDMDFYIKDSLYGINNLTFYPLDGSKSYNDNGINRLFTQLCYYDSLSDVKIENFAEYIKTRVKVSFSLPVQEKFSKMLGFSTINREYSFENFTYSISRITRDLSWPDKPPFDKVECSLYDIPFNEFREQLKTKRYIDDLTGKIYYNYSYFVNPNQEPKYASWGCMDEDDYKKYLGLVEWK